MRFKKVKQLAIDENQTGWYDGLAKNGGVTVSDQDRERWDARYEADPGAGTPSMPGAWIWIPGIFPKRSMT